MLAIALVALVGFAASVCTAHGPDGVTVSDRGGRRVCTVFARGNRRNDVPNIIRAFEACERDATVVFPEDQTYWISEKLHVTLDNVEIKWRGKWLVCPR